MNKAILFLIFTIAVFNLHAQEEEKEKTITSSSFFINLGYSNLDAQAFSNSWEPGVFGDISTPGFLLSFGSSYFYPRFMFNWEFNSNLGGSGEGANHAYRLSAFEGNLNFGYMVKSSSSLLVYPTVGVGFGSSSFTFESKDISANNVSDLFDINGAMLNSTFLVIPLAVNTDFLIGKRDNVKFVLGLSAGYNLNINLSDWRQGSILGRRTDRNSFSELEPFNTQGFFVRARIAVWSIDK